MQTQEFRRPAQLPHMPKLFPSSVEPWCRCYLRSSEEAQLAGETRKRRGAGRQAGSRWGKCAHLKARTQILASALKHAWQMPTAIPRPLHRWHGQAGSPQAISRSQAHAVRELASPRHALHSNRAVTCDRKRHVPPAGPHLMPLEPPNRKEGWATSTTPIMATGIPSSTPMDDRSFKTTGLQR